MSRSARARARVRADAMRAATRRTCGSGTGRLAHSCCCSLYEKMQKETSVFVEMTRPLRGSLTARSAAEHRRSGEPQSRVGRRAAAAVGARARDHQGGVSKVQAPGAAILHDAAKVGRRGTDHLLRVSKMRPQVLDELITREHCAVCTQYCMCRGHAILQNQSHSRHAASASIRSRSSGDHLLLLRGFTK